MKTIEEIKAGEWKMRVSYEEFRAVEKIVCENGGRWFDYSDKLEITIPGENRSFLAYPFLIISKFIMSAVPLSNVVIFENHSFKEVSYQEFMMPFIESMIENIEKLKPIPDVMNGKYRMVVSAENQWPVQFWLFFAGCNWSEQIQMEYKIEEKESRDLNFLQENYIIIQDGIINSFVVDFYSKIRKETFTEINADEFCKICKKTPFDEMPVFEKLGQDLDFENKINSVEVNKDNFDLIQKILFYLGCEWVVSKNRIIGFNEAEPFILIGSHSTKILTTSCRPPLNHEPLSVENLIETYSEFVEQKKLDVKFTRDGATVTAEILFQDDSLRRHYGENDKILSEKNGYKIESVDYHQIIRKTYYINGSLKNLKKETTFLFNSENDAIHWLENIQGMIEDINGAQPELKHATVNETLDQYRTKDKYSLGKSYWYCLVDGGEAPKHQHESYEIAKEEAERLEKLTGKDVEILQAVGVVWHEYTNIEKCELIAKAKEKGGCKNIMDYLEHFLSNNAMSNLTVEFIMKNLTSDDQEWAMNHIGLRLPGKKSSLINCPKCKVFNYDYAEKCMICGYNFSDIPF